MNKKAGIYVRVSTERQVKEGYSIEAQKENLINFSNRQGFNIVDIYSDEGISGKNIKDRKEVKRLIEDIKKGIIDVVVLYKFDRLTRDSKDTEDIISLLQLYENIEIYTLSGGVIDVSSATGRFNIRINGAVAQLEREQTIERIKLAFKEKTRQGYTLATNITCYGYDRKRHEKIQTVNKKEADIVKRIFKMYLNGLAFKEICNVLNSEKIKTKMSGRKVKNYVVNSVWMPKTIRLILTNPTYIGKVRYHIGKLDYLVLDGKHKPIISKKIWNETQLLLQKRKRISKTNIPKQDVYFCGTLYCGICGHKLTPTRTVRIKKDGTKTIYNGYRCINREKNKCNAIGISHKKVEEIFLKYIDQFEELDIDSNTINNTDEKELARLNKSMIQLNNKYKEIMDLFLINSIDKKQFDYMTLEITKKQKFIKEEILKKSTKIINEYKIPKTIKEHFKFLSQSERLDFLNQFVEKIEIINKDKVEITSFKLYDE